MVLYIIFILIFFVIAVTNSYNFTKIASNKFTGNGAKPLTIDDAERYAYTSDENGPLYKVDISTGITIALTTRGVSLNNPIALYSINRTAAAYNNLLFGGYNVISNYDSLTTGGTITTPFTNVNVNVNTLWPNCMVTDATNKKIYISDTAGVTRDTRNNAATGAIWVLDINVPFVAPGSLVKLILKDSSNVNYTPRTPFGMALRNTNLYFVEEYGYKVCKVNINTGVITEIISGIPSTFARPWAIAVDSAQNFAYVSTGDAPVNGVLKVDLSTTNTFINLVSASNPVSAVSAMIMDKAEQYIYMVSGTNLIKMSLNDPTAKPSSQPSSSPSYQPSGH